MADPPDWRSLTDQELIDAQFDIVDPEALPGVVTDLPLDFMESVEGQYDTSKTTNVLVRCIHCKKSNHYHGFVFKTPSDDRILVGIDCGGKIYGVQFNKQQNEFNTARKRRDALIARRYALDHGSELLSHAHQLAAHPSLALFKETRSAYLKAFPDLARKVVEACRRGGGALFVDERSRNYEAEAARDSRLDVREARLAKEAMNKTERGKERRDIAQQRGKPIYRYPPTLIGTLKGQPFFLTTSPSPHTRIPELIADIESDLLDLNLDPPITSKLRAQLHNVRDALASIIEQVGTLAALPEAFSLQNLALLAQWGNARAKSGETYEAHDFAITRRSSTWESDNPPAARSVAYPQGFALPSATPFSAFKNAVAGRL
jgi:hypothetical protein